MSKDSALLTNKDALPLLIGTADVQMNKLFSMILEDDQEGLDEFFGSQPPDKTSTLLVEDLMTKYPDWKNKIEISEIIKKALELEYDENHTEEAFCKVTLAQDLMKIGAYDLVEKVKEGRYD